MWNEIKQQQLNDLRQREAENPLTADESLDLKNLILELEQEEWQRLNPALEREREQRSHLQEEISRVETQNAVLAAIAARQDDLAKRAAVQLKSLQIEHEVLKNERERILNDLAA